MTFEKMMLLAFLAALIAGPKNLPRYAQWFGKTVRTVLSQWQTTKENLKEEAGVDADVDWHQFDPRQYDPRRIIREAIREQPHGAPAVAAPASPAPAAAGDAEPLPPSSMQTEPAAVPPASRAAADAAIRTADLADRAAPAADHPTQPVVPQQPQS